MKTSDFFYNLPEELIAQIRKDGVQAAENQAEAILVSAKAEAEKIIAGRHTQCRGNIFHYETTKT